MAAEAYSSAEKIKKLESELATLKESNTSAPTSLQLEAARQEIMNLKTRLDAIQVKYESAEKEIERYIPQIQDLERSISEFRSAAYAKDEELIATYNQTNDNLKKEIEELQRVRACLLEENEHLKSENDGFEASLIQNQADFYKLGYVDHLYGRPSDFKFSGKDFETFSISPEDLLAFTFEFSIGEIVEGVDTQVGAVGGKDSEDAAAENTKADESVTTEQLGDVQATEE
ncbi:hypothetical protein ACFX2K_038008 [Malus domestica]